MKKYDVIVVGSGSGAIVAERALASGLKVALIEKGPVGGTCLNVGCIPSKMLVYPADVVAAIQNAKKLGITAEIKDIDFHTIMERMRTVVREGHDDMKRGVEHTKNLDFYQDEAFFTDDYTLQVKGDELRGKKIFIASGARPVIPPVDGIDQIAYLTNETVLQLTEKPESLLIIGGGYIAAEYGHFFAAMGTAVTIVQRGPRLVPNEEPEISDVLKEEMKTRMSIYINTEVVKVKQGDRYTVVGRDTKTGEEKEVQAEQIMVAAGRKSNADVLKVEATGVKTDARGYITVDEYLQTTKEGIWAFGDATGKQMFRHMANKEADIVWHNSTHKEKIPVDYSAVPHAVFTWPQIASVGLTEEQAKPQYKILVGKAPYSSVAKGMAMMEDTGFAKAIVDKKTWRILGFHIIGPYAPILIQEVTNAMAAGGNIHLLAEGIHIHPALTELVLTAFSYLREP
jgi:dihydrolipoamide dehydrogenase